MTEKQNIQHLLSRAGFGPRLKEFTELENNSLSNVLNTIFRNSDQTEYLNVVQPDIISPLKFQSLTESKKQEQIQKSRELIVKLNSAWIHKMINDKSVLREKLTFFWHDHFACRTPNPWFAQQLNNVMRNLALDKFGNLLLAVTKSPAMLQFLNNQQNRKSSPNENFARELLELFTIGQGNYTEYDIKSAARAFTGWGFNQQGKYIFRTNLHDHSRKDFMGKSGSFNGENILKIILDRRETATFLTRKIYKYFVNEDVNETHLTSLSESFYNSGYDIKKLMFDIFSSKWFYSYENHKCLIKSPVELLVGLQGVFPIHFRNNKSQVFLQKALGQVLFNPPNVGGWPYGTEWIDSTSLAFRIQLPFALGSSLNSNHKKFGNLEIVINWEDFIKKTSPYDYNSMAVWMLGMIPDSKESEVLFSVIKKGATEQPNKALMILALASLPEYQLC